MWRCTTVELTFPFRRYPDRQGLPRRARTARPLPRVLSGGHRRHRRRSSWTSSTRPKCRAIIYKTFTSLGLQRFKIRINNRKVLNGFFASRLGLTEQCRRRDAHHRQAGEDRRGEGTRPFWSKISAHRQLLRRTSVLKFIDDRRAAPRVFSRRWRATRARTRYSTSAQRSGRKRLHIGCNRFQLLCAEVEYLVLALVALQRRENTLGAARRLDELQQLVSRSSFHAEIFDQNGLYLLPAPIFSSLSMVRITSPAFSVKPRIAKKPLSTLRLLMRILSAEDRAR